MDSFLKLDYARHYRVLLEPFRNDAFGPELATALLVVAAIILAAFLASRRMVVRQRLGVHRQGHARHRNGLGPQALFHASPLARIQRHRGGIRQNLQTRLCSAVDLAGC